MLKPTVLTASALVLLAIADPGRAQAPFANVTPDMIRTSLPVEGAPLAEKGAYEVTSEPTFGSPGHVIVRPANLDAFPKKDTLPVIAWGNGGCAIDSKSFMGFMQTVASHGFLVIGTAPIEGAAQRRANVDDLRTAIDWADKENSRDGSPLKGKIATGQSGRDGQLVRRLPLDRGGRRPARQDDRRVQLGRDAPRPEESAAVSDPGRRNAREAARTRAARERPRAPTS